MILTLTLCHIAFFGTLLAVVLVKVLAKKHTKAKQRIV